MKKKILLSIIFAASLLPMLLNQFGGMRGVQEISGIIILLSPLGVISVVLYAVGVWVPFKRKFIGRAMATAGACLMVVAEIYKFLTWHYANITGEISLQNSLRLAFPEFYFGLAVSVFAAVICTITESLELKDSRAT